MVVPVLLIMAGAAMLGGGPVMVAEGFRRKALWEAEQLDKATFEALLRQMPIADLRRRVAEAGGDPDQAERLKLLVERGKIDVSQIEDYLRGLVTK